MTAPALADCDFYAEINDAGYFVGRCPQYPDVHGRSRKRRLDAVDDIIDQVRDHIQRQTDK
ncbi:hypothetical protein NM962_01300 [Mycobacterium sp. SVM_VP21]|nr:hypothetical protein NM962_01300 [Mycobacterium sp. SVM_VP21]